MYKSISQHKLAANLALKGLNKEVSARGKPLEQRQHTPCCNNGFLIGPILEGQIAQSYGCQLCSSLTWASFQQTHQQLNTSCLQSF